ncbi:MAG: DNA2/NAM7 family helicase, partial [Proteobacteria bacterium]|nr:DNA2/NAM7 family helicase [Pseudomonadota bacterium]
LPDAFEWARARSWVKTQIDSIMERESEKTSAQMHAVFSKMGEYIHQYRELTALADDWVGVAVNDIVGNRLSYWQALHQSTAERLGEAAVIIAAHPQAFSESDATFARKSFFSRAIGHLSALGAIIDVSRLVGVAINSWQKHTREIPGSDVGVMTRYRHLQDNLKKLTRILELRSVHINACCAAAHACPGLEWLMMPVEVDVDNGVTAGGQASDAQAQALTEQSVPGLVREFLSSYQENDWHARVDKLAATFKKVDARQRRLGLLDQGEASATDLEIQKFLSDLERQENAIIESLAASYAWSQCFARMTDEHRREMKAWQQSMSSYGKGTGKYAHKHRKNAQKHLSRCRDAIPAFIMPMHRVWDAMNPVQGMFDVVIVDEASQCGVDSLALLYYGRKTIVVGDDKQISPDFVFDKGVVHELIDKHLGNFTLNDSFYLERSLFDHGRLLFSQNSIMLCEHFRCMPEIIEFSNQLSYDGQLIPLRQHGRQRLEPLLTRYIADGTRRGSSGSIVNAEEAQAVAQEVARIVNDRQYDGKSIGVISLQGKRQAREIEKCLQTVMGIENIENRAIKCGDAYSFQGAERDVILLSLVASLNSDHQRIGVLSKDTDQQRFNVAASRAKDQMILFHSVGAHLLHPDCVRRKLTEFFPADPTAGHNAEYVAPVRSTDGAHTGVTEGKHQIKRQDLDNQREQGDRKGI